MCKRFGTFVLGGLVGATLALLYAPRPGAQTRAQLAGCINDAFDSNELGAQIKKQVQPVVDGAFATSQEVFEQVSSQAQEVFESAAACGVEAVSNLQAQKPHLAADSDELRSRIEAARNKIAAQVAKNAVQDAEDLTDQADACGDELCACTFDGEAPVQAESTLVEDEACSSDACDCAEHK